MVILSQIRGNWSLIGMAVLIFECCVVAPEKVRIGHEERVDLLNIGWRWCCGEPTLGRLLEEKRGHPDTNRLDMGTEKYFIIEKVK